MEKKYHLALMRGTGPTQCWRNGHAKSTLVLIVRENLDCMPTDIHEYIGYRIVTKKHLKDNKAGLLKMFNENMRTNFRTLIID